MQQKELVEYIARSLVDSPEQVEVREAEGEQGAILELSVSKEDLGKIIGKQGRTARAIRTLLGAVSAKTKKRVVLEIVE
ncbi:MAG: KH domain-containing protein [Mailhella sp.]|nr:KH domain-containing protein [Mailhella sp.]